MLHHKLIGALVLFLLWVFIRWFRKHYALWPMREPNQCIDPETCTFHEPAAKDQTFSKSPCVAYLKEPKLQRRIRSDVAGDLQEFRRGQK